MEITYKWLEGDPDLTPPEEPEKVMSKREREWERRFENLLLLRRNDGSLIYPRTSFTRDGAWVCPSTSREGVEHFVYLRDGRICCTCEGWLARGYSKHTFLPEFIARRFEFTCTGSYYFGVADFLDGETHIWLSYAGRDYESRIWEARVFQGNMTCRHLFPDWFVKRMLRWQYSGEPSWMRVGRPHHRQPALPKNYDPFE